MPPGAPTKLTPEVQAEIIRNLASGCYIETACAVAGIGKTSYYEWLKRGEAGEEPYSGFLNAVREAEHRAELRALALIHKAGEEDPKHLEWWLERKFADRWARNDKVRQEHSGEVQVQHNHTFEHLTVADLARLAANGDGHTDSSATGVGEPGTDESTN